MTQFLLSVFLFLSFFPAVASVLFARRSLSVWIWNAFWYYLMAEAGLRVFGSPHGAWAGGVFAVLFVLRAFLAPTRVQSFRFWTYDPSGGQKSASTKQKVPASRQTVDAEFDRLSP